MLNICDCGTNYLFMGEKILYILDLKFTRDQIFQYSTTVNYVIFKYSHLNERIIQAKYNIIFKTKSKNGNNQRLLIVTHEFYSSPHQSTSKDRCEQR